MQYTTKIYHIYNIKPITKNVFLLEILTPNRRILLRQ